MDKFLTSKSYVNEKYMMIPYLFFISFIWIIEKNIFLLSNYDFVFIKFLPSFILKDNLNIFISMFIFSTILNLSIYFINVFILYKNFEKEDIVVHWWKILVNVFIGLFFVLISINFLINVEYIIIDSYVRTLISAFVAFLASGTFFYPIKFIFLKLVSVCP